MPQVRFIKNELPFAEGEVATFSEKDAARLVSRKVAEYEPEEKPSAKKSALPVAPVGEAGK